ncbi:MAG TPA: sulfur carrier protein ThiS [Malonomonas sp.]
MNLQINGQNREYPSPLTIVQLLDQLDLAIERVVVELNREILTADKLADTQLTDGDTLELIQFVGGG